MTLDIPRKPHKLRVPGNSPAIVMPKEGEGPPQETAEKNTQAEQVRAPVRRADTSFSPPQEQTVFDQMAALQQQLAQARQEAQQAQTKLEQHEAKRELKNERQRDYRERNLAAVRQRDAAYRRKRRARERGKNPAQ